MAEANSRLKDPKVIEVHIVVKIRRYLNPGHVPYLLKEHSEDVYTIDKKQNVGDTV
jgi:hypothetical protein